MSVHIKESGGPHAWRGFIGNFNAGRKGDVLAQLQKNSDRGHALPLKEFCTFYSNAQVPFAIVERERHVQLVDPEVTNNEDFDPMDIDNVDYDNMENHPEWNHLPSYHEAYANFRPNYTYDIPITTTKVDVEYKTHATNSVAGSILCIRNHPTGNDCLEARGGFYREAHHMQSILQREGREPLKPTAGDLYPFPANRNGQFPYLPEEQFQPVTICLEYGYDDDIPGLDDYYEICLSKPLYLKDYGDLGNITKKYNVQMKVCAVHIPDDADIDRKLIHVHENKAFFAVVHFDSKLDFTPDPVPDPEPHWMHESRQLNAEQMDNMYLSSDIISIAASTTRPLPNNVDNNNDYDSEERLQTLLHYLSWFEDPNARVRWTYEQGKDILAQAIVTRANVRQRARL
jgi:hypothetical protein